MKTESHDAGPFTFAFEDANASVMQSLSASALDELNLATLLLTKTDPVFQNGTNLNTI